MFSPTSIIIIATLLLALSIVVIIASIYAVLHYRQKTRLAFQQSMIQEQEIVRYMLLDTLSYNVNELLQLESMLLKDLQEQHQLAGIDEVFALHENISKALGYFINTLDDDNKHLMSMQAWLEQFLIMYQFQRSIAIKVDVCSSLELKINKAARVLLLKTLQDVLFPIIKWLVPTWINVRIGLQANRYAVALKYTTSQSEAKHWRNFVNNTLLEVRLQQLNAIMTKEFSGNNGGFTLQVPIQSLHKKAFA